MSAPAGGFWSRRGGGCPPGRGNTVDARPPGCRAERPDAGEAAAIWRERCHVVENPEGAAVGRDHEIVAGHHEIMERGLRQIELQALPVRAVVEGDECAGLGGGVEQSAFRRVLAHGMHEGAIR